MPTTKMKNERSRGMCIISTVVFCLLATVSAQQSARDSQDSSYTAAFAAVALAAPTPEVKLFQACLDVSICLDYLTSPQFPSPGGQFMPCPVGPASDGIGLQARFKKDREGAGPGDGCA
jgi:hypothetical protein